MHNAKQQNRSLMKAQRGTQGVIQMKAKGNTGIDFTQIRWFSGIQARRLDCVSSGQKTLKESLKLKGTLARDFRHSFFFIKSKLLVP